MQGSGIKETWDLGTWRASKVNVAKLLQSEPESSPPVSSLLSITITHCHPPLLMPPGTLSSFSFETRSQGPPKLGQDPKGLWWWTACSLCASARSLSKELDQGV